MSEDLLASWPGVYPWTCMLIALLLEHFLPIAEHQHPLTGWRYLATAMAQKVNRQQGRSAYQQRISGTLGMIMLLVTIWPFQIMVTWLIGNPWIWQTLLLTLLLSWRPVKHRALAVGDALKLKQHQLAREQLTPLVVRDTTALSPLGITKATLESTLFRFINHYVGVLFWFWVAGINGAVGYRLIILLAEYWNPKQAEYRHFGAVVYRLAQLLCWLPARASWLWLMLWGNIKKTLGYRSVISEFSSRCGGWLLAAGSAHLGCHLGGPVYYQQKQRRVRFHSQREPKAVDIHRLLRWLNFSLLAWVIFSGVLIAAINIALAWPL